MAKIKETMTVSLEEFGKKAGEYALDEFEYKGLTIRQWADKITSGEYQPVKQEIIELLNECRETIFGATYTSGEEHTHAITLCDKISAVIGEGKQ